jgi:protein SCO1/2
MKLRIIVFSLIAITGMVIAGFMIKNRKVNENSAEYREKHNNILKVINPFDVNKDLVEDSLELVRSGHTISDFKFVNQYGDTITQVSVDNQIYVANYFFTTCGSICPIMNDQMKRVHDEFLNDDWLRLLSHTVWPEGDSIQRLYDYSIRYDVKPEKWWFMTGSKEELYNMARQSYLVVPDVNDTNYVHGDESDFIHTENFVLIDPKHQIRGIYDGTNPDEISNLIKDIYDLKREFKF